MESINLFLIFVAVEVDESWVMVGQESPVINCNVKGAGSQPSDFTISDGTTTWTKDNTANQATTSVSANI